MKTKIHLPFITTLSFCAGCGNKNGGQKQRSVSAAKDTYVNPLLPEGADPSVLFHNGKHYYTHGTEDKILLWETSDIIDMAHSVCKMVWRPEDPSNRCHPWAPETHYTNDKWYIYYAADDGNTDNHQLYVFENSSPDFMQGKFEMKGSIMTNPEWNWGIQATTFEHKGVRYLAWSGWPKRRTNAETQCIYIARMKDPWTPDSPRVLIFRPEYEWERQWVNPDGSRTAYPIYVNEGSQFFHSKDNKTLILYYAASGSWSPYHCIGMLTADVESDLLDPAPWTKSPVPVFQQSPENEVYGLGGLSFVPSPDGTEWYMIYHARQVTNGDTGSPETRNPRIQKIGWDANGMPDLGIPVRAGVALPKPSGIPLK